MVTPTEHLPMNLGYDEANLKWIVLAHATELGGPLLKVLV